MVGFRRLAAPGWFLIVATLVATWRGGAAQQTPPTRATAQCRDGSYSFSKHHSGTCSHHGGVAMWLDTRDTARALSTAAEPPPDGSPMCGVHCGTERWAIKTLSDSDRGRVRMQPVDATVEELVALVRPPKLSQVARADPVELTLYRVEARLLYLFTEADNDYHLVLASPRDTTLTMIAEVPDPGCSGACASGRAEVYGRVRGKLMDRLNSPQSEARPLIRVTGVGFFDYLHHQRGVAPNAIELHPVLDVEFP